MRRRSTSPALCIALALLAPLLAPASLVAQVPSPEYAFGFPPGADYQVAGYDQMLTYFRSLADASDRIRLEEIGRSAKGLPLVLLYISSPENLERLDHWRSISERLARGRIDEPEARRLAREGRAVVWVDGGMDPRRSRRYGTSGRRWSCSSTRCSTPTVWPTTSPGTGRCAAHRGRPRVRPAWATPGQARTTTGTGS
jgi:hypothetical protein